MYTSLFDLYKIGIGPSSSHTVGPMRAAASFVDLLRDHGLLPRVERVKVELFGSLALTGHGHGTDRGILLGLMGERPESVDPAGVEAAIQAIVGQQMIHLSGSMPVPFVPERDLVWHRDQTLPRHSNGMRFTAYAVFADGPGSEVLEQRNYYSIGGGFVVGDEDAVQAAAQPVPHPFRSAAELLEIGRRTGLRIDEIARANESALRGGEALKAGIARIWQAMQQCIARGLSTEGTLPGGLRVRRRAAAQANRLKAVEAGDQFMAMDWLNAYAIAVNEENAAGGRVVTAPTNGAAGIVPAVAQYYWRHMNGDMPGIERYFLASAAIGALYKENASISGAEVGCQGEVGVACSMAAAGLAAALQGNNEQVEHAAEIGMEHNLGMTCDPIGGLVQIPCIERNAFGAVKAVNAARMALRDTGDHKVSLDQVIRTMYQTGLDMQTRYKETSLGGLAVHVVEC
jgi:L-serine dehydratase